MAQTLASSPEIIYNTLVADATFMGQVGQYTFASGSTTPSIIIATPGKDLPNVASQTGLEVIIHDVADLENRLYLTDPADALYTWRVFLVVWEPATGANVTTAASRILAKFPKATSIETVSVASTLGVAFQTQVRIPSDCPIL
jgi:hypothetical protein